MGDQAGNKREAPFKELGPISHGIERAFYYMHKASLAQWWIGSGRTESIDAYVREKRLTIVKNRSRRVEQYLLLWLCVEISLLLADLVAGKYGQSSWFLSAIPLWLSLICLVLIPAYRVFEIVQAVININLFDAVRRDGSAPNYVASLSRMVILSMWNWFEVVLCFAIFYGSQWARFRYAYAESPTTGAGLYFSVITQLTIGYGDVSPIRATQLAAAAQGLIGFLLGIIVLSRLVSFLPRFVSVTHATTEDGPNPACEGASDSSLDTPAGNLDTPADIP
ncbi:potassium channel family protein [Paraburkholderia bryophila]|uniref:Ion channel n=1 Tax=Paraburkholderia bryophila TaxID=420952 RepID=A0A329D6Y0_9BURK|nr:potassium channel family protein [Paraburkholderia bryophila]RAS38295.1 ion channel [Paraburkholderia bryophila]